MIKTEKEYLESKNRLDQEYQTIEEHKLKMKNAGLNEDQIRMAIDPLLSFAIQLKEEVEEYEKLKRGQFDKFVNLNGIGRTLVALRIYKGLSQKQLAEKLMVAESQVSRDERNEYHGASIEKIEKILNSLGVVIKSEIDADFRNVI